MKFCLFCFNLSSFFLDSDADDEGENNAAKRPETVNFVVMLKKNNKPQVNNSIYVIFSNLSFLMNLVVL